MSRVFWWFYFCFADLCLFYYDYKEGASADDPHVLGWLVGWLVGWRHIINIPPTRIVCSNTNDQEPGQN